MSKAKKAVKSKKQKMTPEQRSQVARDRWAKRRQAATPEIEVTWPETTVVTTTTNGTFTDRSGVTIFTSPEPVVITQQEFPVGEAKAQFAGLSGDPINRESFRPAPSLETIPAPPVETPAPQLAPVKAPKQKRYQGPKEFSVALRAAESRLAKAIVERAQAAGQLAALQAEIPSLLQIIQALKGSSQVPMVPAQFDFSGSVPNAQAYQSPIPQYQAPGPLQAIQAAQVAPPISRAQGGAIQFGPEVTGALEGPEDDDPDRFITGPNAGGSGWIGG